MNETAAVALREPFEPGQIGKLPKVTCRDCSDKNTNCTKHQRSKCSVCGAYISSAHIHLDYVGHAAVTDRLLQVDPEWNWEPVAFGEDGTPVIRREGREARMWIKLTIAGTTRLAVGIAAADSFELEKQLISDAIRNGAMRFGVALDLWSKEDLQAPPDGVDAQTGEVTGAADSANTPPDSEAGPVTAGPDLATKRQLAKIDHLVDRTGAIPKTWPLPDDFTKAAASKLIDELDALPQEPPAQRVGTLRADAEQAQEEFAT